MDIIIILFRGLVIVLQAIYTVSYTLFGPGMYFLIAVYILYKVYPHSVTLQYIISWFVAKLRWWLESDSLSSNERAWLTCAEKAAFKQALADKDWAAAKKMKKLAGNRDELFEYLLEYYKVESLEFRDPGTNSRDKA